MRFLMVGLGLGFLIGLGAVVFRAPLLDAVHAHIRPDDSLTLTEGLRPSIDLVDATTEHVASDRDVTTTSDSADVEQASELQNNYSLIDHSDPVNYPGYDDCDAVKHLIEDGWSAVYRVKFSLRDEQDAQRLIRETRDFWVSKGYQVQKAVYDPSPPRYKKTRLWIESDDASFQFIQFNVDRRRGEATFKARTECLPPQ